MYIESLQNPRFADSATNSSPTQAAATFKIDYTKLYDAICKTLNEDQTTLLLYLLLHKNQSMKSFILSRTNIDQLVSIATFYHLPVWLLQFYK